MLQQRILSVAARSSSARGSSAACWSLSCRRPRTAAGPTTQAALLCRRHESTTSQTPPLIARLRQDLKTAMRAKDAPRLAVIRALLADITDASKTSSPVTNDVQILALCRKRGAAARAAAEQFAAEQRPDLQQKEAAQLAVLDEYAGAVQTVSADEIRQKVTEAVEQLETKGKQAKGQLMKRLLGPGGVFDGQPVEKGEVGKAVDAALGL